jgi:hypothetical protein
MTDAASILSFVNSSLTCTIVACLNNILRFSVLYFHASRFVCVTDIVICTCFISVGEDKWRLYHRWQSSLILIVFYEGNLFWDKGILQWRWSAHGLPSVIDPHVFCSTHTFLGGGGVVQLHLFRNGQSWMFLQLVESTFDVRIFLSIGPWHVGNLQCQNGVRYFMLVGEILCR